MAVKLHPSWSSLTSVQFNTKLCYTRHLQFAPLLVYHAPTAVLLHCRRILAWLGLTIMLASSLAGLALHTRSMWLPPLSDALYGVRATALG